MIHLCNYLFDLRLKHLFASVDKSKFSGKVPYRISGMKGLSRYEFQYFFHFWFLYFKISSKHVYVDCTMNTVNIIKFQTLYFTRLA